MRLQSLHINHFGHFSDFDLPFGAGECAVLFGHNEAGKSTLLEFLRQLLFGFDERTPYSFGEGGEIGGAAQLRLADNRAVELRRRKGRKNTVQVSIDGRDTDLDETGFHHLLGHADKEVFKSVFAFGLDELRRGNEALKHESLQSALFGGGLGGTINPEKLLDDFDNQAGELFKPSAIKPTINALCKEIAELAKSVKAKAIRSSDYETRHQNWLDAQQTAEQLARDLADLRVRHSRTEKLLKALPLWLQRRGRCDERSRLIVPAGFPNSALTQFHTVAEAIGRLTRERDQLAGELKTTDEKLSATQLDQTPLPLKAEITDCHGLVKSVEEARRDVPLRQSERDAIEREITTTLRELRPGWTLDALQAFSLDAATRHKLESLSDLRQTLEDERTKLTTRRQSVCEEVSRIVDELADLGTPQDVTEVAAIVEQSAEYTNDRQMLQKEIEARAKLAVTLETQQTKLSPPLPVDASDPHRMPVPPQELIVRFDGEFRDLAEQAATARQSLNDAMQTFESLEQELSQLEQQKSDVPTLEDLAAGRSRRDECWRLIRQQYFEEQDRTTQIAEWLGNVAARLPEAFEQAVAQADQLSDAIYEYADIVTSRKQLQLRLEQARQVVERKQADHDRASERQQAAARRWEELWRPCEFAPLPPDVMRRWLDEHSAFVATREHYQHKEVELDSLRQRLDRFEAAFRAAIQKSDGDVLRLLSDAKKQIKSSELSAEQRKKLDRDQKRQQKMLDGIEAELRELASREQTWKSDWNVVLARLEFRSDWTPKFAHGVIEHLSNAQMKLKKLSELDQRIGLMSKRIREFDARVQQLCVRCAEPFDVDRPELSAKRLQDRLATAAKDQERQHHLQNRADELRRELSQNEDELQKQQQRHNELLSLAGARTDTEFTDVAERARQAAEWDTDLIRLSRDIELLRGNEPADEFEQQLQKSDPSVLQAQLTDLDNELTRQQADANAAREAAGRLKHIFDELDGRNEAALLHEEVARKQARLASEVHRYVPLVFAKKLLRQSIQRFERDNQPELIGDISRLLDIMTRGRYREIERPLSDPSTLYVRRADGAERRPDQLSTGTREQLYVAIRLGYVLHYCRQTEPLPIVMDDVLVNFDAQRARATLEALREVSHSAQVLFFTCHPHLIDLIRDVFPNIQPIELPTLASGK